VPKYIYQCESCSDHFEIYHGMMEDKTECPQCESKDFYRVPQIPFLEVSKEPKGGKVGDKTKDAIEENRKVLETMKKERKGRDYYRDDN
jgi:putative FmdB family regulatory protein